MESEDDELERMKKELDEALKMDLAQFSKEELLQGKMVKRKNQWLWAFFFWIVITYSVFLVFLNKSDLLLFSGFITTISLATLSFVNYFQKLAMDDYEDHLEKLHKNFKTGKEMDLLIDDIFVLYDLKDKKVVIGQSPDEPEFVFIVNDGCERDLIFPIYKRPHLDKYLDTSQFDYQRAIKFIKNMKFKPNDADGGLIHDTLFDIGPFDDEDDTFNRVLIAARFWGNASDILEIYVKMAQYNHIWKICVAGFINAAMLTFLGIFIL